MHHPRTPALGASVAIVGRDADKLDAVHAEIRYDGGRVSVHAADIRDEAPSATSSTRSSPNTDASRVVQRRGRTIPGAPGDHQHQGFEAVVRNNLTGGFIVMREVYTKWMRSHGGAIGT